MNIFIAGLSYNISDSDLTELFAEYGEVASARVISDRETGRSKGYGFVEMADEEAGNKAISALNEANNSDRKSTRLNSSHASKSRMPSSA